MINQIKIEDIWKIQKVAHLTWPATFKDILSEKQIYYMLDWMYSTRALVMQIDNGHVFWSYEQAGLPLGFIGIERHTDVLKIHKLYVLPDFQGKSIGKKLIERASHYAIEHDIKRLTLNVNRFNSAVSFYKRIGFGIIKSEDIDIGNGYLMEDYVMEKIIE